MNNIKIFLELLIYFAIIMTVAWALLKIYEAIVKKFQIQFPIGRLFGGALLGGFFAYSSTVNTIFFDGATLVRETKLPFSVYFIFALLIGFIPMIIAYTKNIKNKNAVYWLSFAAMCAPAGLVWFFIALIRAICGKQESEIENDSVRKQKSNKRKH